MTTSSDKTGANSLQIRHTPECITLTNSNLSYLISHNDIDRLKKGYCIPLRDLDKKPLGPVGCVYTRKNETEIRLPSGELFTVPSRLLNTADCIRRVLLPSSPEAVTA